VENQKMSKRSHTAASFSDLIHFQGEKTLVVNFACFVTCLSNRQHDPGEVIKGLNVPGFEIPCVSVAVNGNQAMEIYMECDGMPLTRLLCFLEQDMGLCCVAIFTFGSNSRTNGAPEALARIRYRVERCGFSAYTKGFPSAEECMDFDIRDRLSNWVRFTSDQMGLMLSADGSRPCEVVEWCVVLCSGDTSKLELKLRALRIRTGACRQYFIRGFECTRVPMAARVYMEIEPIVKTVLLRCLVEALGMSVEIMTFSRNQQAKALAYVFDLGGCIIEHGNLSEVSVVDQSNIPCVMTRFTQKDLAVWDCVVSEPPPLHWSVVDRDTELARLVADNTALRMENSLLQSESSFHRQQCGRILCAVEELKKDRDRLLSELDFKGAAQGENGLVGWAEWESMRTAVDERDKCISQLKAQLCDMDDQLQKIQRGDMVMDDQGRWLCVGGSETLCALGEKIRSLEHKLATGFEGGLAFDQERNRIVRTGGRTWTIVQWQLRELGVYRSVFGSIATRDSFGEMDFAFAGVADGERS
jgi:hypothetical protein